VDRPKWTTLRDRARNPNPETRNAKQFPVHNANKAVGQALIHKSMSLKVIHKSMSLKVKHTSMSLKYEPFSEPKQFPVHNANKAVGQALRAYVANGNGLIMTGTRHEQNPETPLD